MLPFIATIIILVINGRFRKGNSVPPEALGKPYRRGERQHQKLPLPLPCMDIKVTIGEHIFKAHLHTDKAPETCKLLLEKMPITGKAIQARWSGEAVWLQMDPYGIEVPQENATCYPGTGQLLYYPGGVSEKEILIPYGSAIFASKFELLPGNHFATITDLEMLERMGEKVLWDGAQSIKLEKL